MKELDFLILESVIFYPEVLSLLASHLEYPRSDLAVSTYELFLKGYLEMNVQAGEDINQNLIFSLADVYSSLNCKSTLWYSLTPNGGKYLEQETSFDWNSFYQIRQYKSIPLEWRNQIFINDNIDKESLRFIYSNNQSILQSWLAEKNIHTLGNSTLKELSWCTVRNQRILYWKELSDIHILSFSSEKSFTQDILEGVVFDTDKNAYIKKINLYTIPKFSLEKPSELLPEYFEYYDESTSNHLEWEINYIILKLGILYKEIYKIPSEFHIHDYLQESESVIVESFSYLFECNFIEATIFDCLASKTFNKEVIANKVFLNNVGVQSVIDFQLIAKFSVTEKGFKYCQFLEETCAKLPKIGD